MSRRRLLAGTLAGLLFVLALASAYALVLDRELVEKWTARQSNLASRIYSAPTLLYPGLDVQAGDLPGTLEVLGYRETAGTPKPGEFRPGDGELVVYLRDFSYPEGPFHGHPLRILLEDRRIASLEDPRTGGEVFTARLEPHEVSAIFDARMQRRSPVELADVPPELLEAILAVEDQRFYRHQGLDTRRIVRAALINVRERRFAEGGSTLTQQLIKNYYLHHRKTLGRKVKEAVMARVFESRYSKEEILEAYLNEVYLGQEGAASIMGVGEAARHYFSKPVGQLDLPEAALLAGLIRAPGRYDPSRHPERARDRRATVLALMAGQGRIDVETARTAAEAPLPAPRAHRGLMAAPYFTDFVLRELQERFSRDALESEGYRIFTSLELTAQRSAERAVADGLTALERSHGSLAPAAGREPLQAAVVALNPQTGELLALVGGRDWRGSQFNRAVQARRQPGSVFKPFVYLAALSEYWTLSSILNDSVLVVQVGDREWAPENYDRTFHGRVTARRALEESYNVATARLALDVGLDRVVEVARRAGIRSPLHRVPSLSLGTFEVTPFEMATGYATLAAGGVRAEPRSILEVVTPEGEILAAHDLRVRRVLPAGPVFLVNRALQGVLENGTASGAAALGYIGPAAGKTGTTNGYRDAWFVGYTPDRLALVWVGFDDNRRLGLTGAQAGLPIWTRFVGGQSDGWATDFTRPDGIVELAVDLDSGKLADAACGPWRLEVFLEGTEPTESCREERSWWRRIFGAAGR